MSFRSYGIIEDTARGLLIMGAKRTGYLSGFLVFFGGRIHDAESAKEALLRQVRDETHGGVSLSYDDTRRFESFEVFEPSPATLVFFRSVGPTYTVAPVSFGEDFSSIVAVSIAKLVLHLPEEPEEVTPELVARAIIRLYGGGTEIQDYVNSGTIRALTDYVLAYHYPTSVVAKSPFEGRSLRSLENAHRVE